ncbi:MAG: TolC family protein [Planctomycetota bacterium]|nr:MAG: TolC family protein [Planctomycetota bacterium]
MAMLRKKFRTVYFGLMVIVPMSWLNAQKREVFPIPVQRLALRECILMALRHNLELKMEALNPRILDAELDKAVAGWGNPVLYEPVFRASVEHVYNENPFYVSPLAAAFFGAPANDKFTPNTQHTATLNFSLEQRFTTGTSYVFSYAHSYTKVDLTSGLKDEYIPQISLQVSQNLLKGLGKIPNEAPILIARNNRKISFLAFRLRLYQILQEVENRFWDVVLAKEQWELKKKSLKVARELTKIAMEKERVGKTSPLETLRFRSAEATREAELLEALNAWKNASDRLAELIMPLRDFQSFRRLILPKVRRKMEVSPLDLRKNLAMALKFRPELEQAKLKLRSSEVYLAKAGNDLLPQLDLSAGIFWTGAGETIGESFREMETLDFYGFQAALNFSYPLFQKGARAEYRKAQLQARQARLGVLLQKRQIYLQIRVALRNLLSAQKIYKARQKSTKFAKRKLDKEKEMFRVGRSTSHNVIKIEEEHRQAEVFELQAKINIYKAQVALEYARGTLLQRHRIIWEDFLSKRLLYEKRKSP